MSQLYRQNENAAIDRVQNKVNNLEFGLKIGIECVHDLVYKLEHLRAVYAKEINHMPKAFDLWIQEAIANAAMWVGEVDDEIQQPTPK